MEKVELYKKDVLKGLILIILLFVLAGGFGYFFGRYQQIQLNRAMLEVIPDVNCGSGTESL